MDIRSLFEKIACRTKSLFTLHAQKNVLIGLFITVAVFGLCAHKYFQKSDMSAIENLPAQVQGTFRSFETRLTQTENKLHQEMSKIEEQVKITEAKLIEAEEKLKSAEGQLSTAGNKLQYTENRLNDIEAKVQSPVNAQAPHQGGELAQVDKEIRKAVKRQIKAIERGE